MRLSTILAPTAEPVSLAAAKTHLRVDHDDEDLLIAGLISVARQYVEAWTKRRLVVQTLRADLDYFPYGVIELPVGPVRDIASVVYLDSAGDSQTLATTLWQSDLRGGLARVLWEASNQPWPTTETGRLNAVTIQFTAGYAIPFTATNATNTLNATAHPLTDGDTLQVWNTGGELPNGLSEAVNYYVVGSTADTFQVSLTSGGAAVTFSADGNGSSFAGTVDAPILAALNLLIGHLYENREQTTPLTLNELPMGISALLMPYTHVRFA